MPKIVCVVPSIRPAQMESFRKAWAPLFEKHQVTLVTVWDGEEPQVTVCGDTLEATHKACLELGPMEMDEKGLFVSTPIYDSTYRDLFCRFTDACRNIGFVVAAKMQPDYVLTLDDDVVPVPYGQGSPEPGADPIQQHIDALNKRVPISWMNTAHDTDLYLRGVPYGVRDESPVMLSHGVWVGTPDFDGETQLRLEEESRQASPTGYVLSAGERSETRLPYALPYFVGPVPKGVLFPLCGMNVMVRREALPYLYFAPMGPDSGVACDLCKGKGTHIDYDQEGGKFDDPCDRCKGSGSTLHRFADIWMGVYLKRQFDALGWACYTGASTVLHTRASDARKNFEQEKLGREWNELLWQREILNSILPDIPEKVSDYTEYLDSYAEKRERYATLIRSLLAEGAK